MKGERKALFDNCITLPNTVRPLRHIVRLPRQRSTRVSYQRINNTFATYNVEEFWVKFQEYHLTIHNNVLQSHRLFLYSKKYSIMYWQKLTFKSFWHYPMIKEYMQWKLWQHYPYTWAVTTYRSTSLKGGINSNGQMKMQFKYFRISPMLIPILVQW
jgi:hypothetical protein